MIFLPVNPASAYGPPNTNLLEGLIIYLVSLDKYFSGTTSLITLIIVSSISSNGILSSCCCDTNIVCAYLGINLPLSFSYSKVT